ncbi:tetratricopeptide repeat protein [Flexibacterium corallicola]|uniref:tetratricopeptide repeat protein n=1 Tax=Flexibacterium corallicola TaxID=3037259 RepID=UPI00286EB4DA|nr:tetratricopeptide repeat protein [Pseudovibrio sp. M1P-2-3]
MRYKTRLVLLALLLVGGVGASIPAQAGDEARVSYDEIDALYVKAESGDTEAQLELAKKYALGQGTPKKPIQAFYWYSKAAEQEHARAQLSLGKMYHIGEGTAVNHEKAVHWVTKSAKQGHAPAQFYLGPVYILRNHYLTAAMCRKPK